jgi:hypothetical protein
VRTVLDLAAFTPFADAVVPVDHVLKADPAQGLPALTKAMLLAGMAGNNTAAAGQRIRAAGESDGVVKYVRPDYLRGRTTWQAVVDEKLTEDRIRASGITVVRWVWAELGTPGQLERKVAAAGVPRRRARAAQ